jgi:hypothetical protein
MAINLVVVTPFGGYERGSVISDVSEVSDILAGELAGHVNRVAMPDDAPVSMPDPDLAPVPQPEY